MKLTQFSAGCWMSLVLACAVAVVETGWAQSDGKNDGMVSGQVQNEAISQIAGRGKHKTDAFTGSFGYSIPIEGAPARNGSQPPLALNYSSGGENSWCGQGWTLDVGYIERNTKDGFPNKWDADTTPKPVKQYDDAKGFMCNLFGKQVKLLPYSGNEYRAEVDTDFMRYIFDPGNNRWDVYDKSGNLYKFGYSSNSRLINPNWTANNTGTFRWALEEIITVTGDRTTITYQTPAGSERVLYPLLISYNGHTSFNGYSGSLSPMHTIQFNLEARTDKRLSYRSGFRTVQGSRLQEIVCKAGGQNVRKYVLGYDYSSSKRSLLAQLRTYDSDLSAQLPVQTFTYQQKSLGFASKVKWGGLSLTNYTTYGGFRAVSSGPGFSISDLLDMDGDGLPDRGRWIWSASAAPDCYAIQRNLGVQANGEGLFEADYSMGPTSTEHILKDATWSGFNALHVRIMDVNSDGRPDRVADELWVAGYPYYGDGNYNSFMVQINNGNNFSGEQKWNGVNTLGLLQSGSYWGAVENGQFVRMFDINGDGIPDRVMRKNIAPFDYFQTQFGTGDPVTPLTSVRQLGPYSSQGKSSESLWTAVDATYVLHMIDINGDGLPDRVMLPLNPTLQCPACPNDSPTKFVVEFNNGYSFEQADWAGVDPQGGGVYGRVVNAPYVGLFDINGDGLPDRVMLKSSDATHKSWYVQLNNGMGFDAVETVSNIDDQDLGAFVYAWSSFQGTVASSIDLSENTVVQMQDMNGDGLLDRVFSDRWFYHQSGNTFKGFWVQTNLGPFPDIMTNVDNGMGGHTAIAYRPSTVWDNRQDPTDANSGKLLPFPVQTVTAITDFDGINAGRTTSYLYEGGFYDGTRREFSGFAKVTVTDPSNRKEVMYFHQGGGRNYASFGSDIGEYADSGSFAKKGMAYRMESYGNDGLQYSMSISKVDQVDLGGGRWFPYVAKTIDYGYPGGGTAKTTATEYTYDSTTGNLTKSAFYGEVGSVSLSTFTTTDIVPADTRYQQISYATISGNDKIKDHPSTIRLTSDSAGSTVLQEAKYTYNANSGTTATEEHRICSGQYSVKSYTYDSGYGIQNMVTDATGVQTTTAYESTYHTYPQTTRKRITANTDSAGDHITSTTYDVRSGLLTASTDPMGVQIQNTFDKFFRLTETKKTPVGGSQFWVNRVTYNLGGVSSFVSANYLRIRVNDGIDTDNGIDSWTYVDGFGRTIETRTEAEQANQFRVVNTVYDERGVVFLTTWPRFESGISFTKPSGTLAASFVGFEPAGRVSETRHRVNATFNADGVYQSYAVNSGDSGSPLGARGWAYKNGTDPWWVVSTDEENKVRRYQIDAFGQTNVIQEVNGAETYTTTLKHDLAGNLTEIINHTGEHIYFTNDDVGNLVAMADPHLGKWTYKRDAAGRVREQLDGKGQKVVFEYSATLSRLSAKKVYDSSSQLVSTATYAYDTSDNGNYVVYKGLLYRISDSEGSVTNGYDTRGRLIKTTRNLQNDARNLGKNQDYTTTYTYNDGDRVTSTGYPNSGPTIYYEYHPSGSLYRVSRSGGYYYYTANAGDFDEFGHVKQFAYGNGKVTTRDYTSYSSSRRLKSIACSGIFTRTYEYNKSDDVTKITGTGLSDTTIGYDDLHRIKTYTGLSGSYNYDAVGNITTSIEGGSSSYTYGNQRKQAVKTAFTKTYLYDLCGNMTVRGSQALEYDAENRLIKLTQTGPNPVAEVEYGYGADGARLWKRNNGLQPQVWIGNFYEEKDGKTLFHVFAGGQRICTFEPGSALAVNGGGGATTHVGYYYHQDNLNSSSALSGSAGQQLEVNVWYPFGRTRTATPQAGFQVSSRFTGQTFDSESGLYYYGARYYDPELGRFIQADTVISDMGNPQSYNRYSYVLNNPLKYTDPTGHETYWEGVGNVFLGYYDAGAGIVNGTIFAVAHPIKTIQGVGTAVTHPIDTGKAIASGIAEDWNSGTRGQGKVVGNALITLGTAVAPAAEAGNLSKLGEFSNIGAKLSKTEGVANSTKLLSFAPKVEFGTAKWGLKHIIERHHFGSTAKDVSKFSRGIGQHEIKGLIKEASQSGAQWQAQGTKRVLDANLGRIIGTDQAGKAVSGLRVVTDSAGKVITAYPIPKP